MAELLLEAGSDVNVRGLHHCTGLVWAAGKNNSSLVALLVSRGAKVEAGDKYGTTPLIWVMTTDITINILLYLMSNLRC